MLISVLSWPADEHILEFPSHHHLIPFSHTTMIPWFDTVQPSLWEGFHGAGSTQFQRAVQTPGLDDTVRVIWESQSSQKSSATDFTS